jgi:hypothetical protein
MPADVALRNEAIRRAPWSQWLQPAETARAMCPMSGLFTTSRKVIHTKEHLPINARESRLGWKPAYVIIL